MCVAHKFIVRCFVLVVVKGFEFYIMIFKADVENKGLLYFFFFTWAVSEK